MIKCDSCGREMNDSWRLLSQPGDGMDTRVGGNCPSCGENLCADCAGEWREIDGESVCEECWTCEPNEIGGVPLCRECKEFNDCDINTPRGGSYCTAHCGWKSPRAKVDEGRKDDSGKLRWDLLPWREVEKVVEVLTYGANKYADNNWKQVVPFKERYTGALMRHFVAWEKGEQIDEESGLFHLAQVITNGLFLLWEELEQHGNTKRT